MKGLSVISSIILIIFLSLISCKSANDDTNTPTPEPEPEDPADSISVNFRVFPEDNPWNKDISKYPLHPDSDTFINSIGRDVAIHPNFGTTWQGAPNGIPFIVVGGDQKKVPINYTAWGDESDPGPFPIPDDAPVEGGNQSDGDRHVLVIDRDNKILYELYRAFKTSEGWNADSGAMWDLKVNHTRPRYWTSADAAGLPIFPGLVRYQEVAEGKIEHALRFTVQRSRRAFIFPASHYASSSHDPALPPMGLRVRLKASFDISGFSKFNQVILTALKKYGMIVADNGSNWMICGAPDERWNDEELRQLKQLRGRDFEVVYTGPTEQ